MTPLLEDGHWQHRKRKAAPAKNQTRDLIGTTIAAMQYQRI